MGSNELHKSDARGPLAFLLIAALLMRLPNLGQSLWFDEACMSDQRIGSWAQLLSTIHIDIHPPLYLVFAHVWNGVFGDSEVSLRVPSLLAGLGSLWLAFTIGKRYVGAAAAWVGVALLCVSPVHIWYSIEGRLYAPMLFFALLSIELFHRVLEDRGGKRTRWLYGLTVFVMLALHYYLAVYVLVLGLAAWVAPRMKWSERVPRLVLWINGFGLVAITIWVFGKAALIGFETSQGYLRAFTPLEVYRFLFQWSWTGNALNAGLEGTWGEPRFLLWTGAQVVGVVLFVRGLIELWRRRRSGSPELLLLANFSCLPLFLFVLPLIGMESTYIERSLLPSLPFFFMIIGLGVVSLTERWKRAMGAVVLVLAAANLVAYYHFDDEWTVYKPHQDWRGAAEYFVGELEDGAAGRPIYTGFPNCRSLPYYDARIQDAKNLAPSKDSAQRGVEGFKRVLGESLGGKLADYAARIATDFEAEKTLLREDAALFVRPIGNGSVKGLRLVQHRSDGTFYLMDNRWHPSSDGRVEKLLKNDAFEKLEEHEFRGVVIHKLRERRP